MNVRKHFSMLLLLVLAGCATASVQPVRTNIVKSQIYNAPYDKVWSAIIAEVAEANLNITTLEKSSGIIAISNVTYNPNWANEGIRGSVMGVPDMVMEREANFNILASQIGPEKTRVEVNSNFKMNVRHGNGSQAIPFTYQWQQAYSNGAFEKVILDSVGNRIAHQ